MTGRTGFGNDNDASEFASTPSTPSSPTSASAQDGAEPSSGSSDPNVTWGEKRRVIFRRVVVEPAENNEKTQDCEPGQQQAPADSMTAPAGSQADPAPLPAFLQNFSAKLEAHAADGTLHPAAKSSAPEFEAGGLPSSFVKETQKDNDKEQGDAVAPGVAATGLCEVHYASVSSHSLSWQSGAWGITPHMRVATIARGGSLHV